MPQFELANALPQIVWLALIFAVLYLTLAYGSLPKVQKVVEQRGRVIASDLEAAETAKSGAQATLAAYEASLAEARAKASAATAEAKAAASQAIAERVKTVDAGLESRISEAAAQIEAARQAALRQLDDVATQATADIVERLTGRRPAPSAVLAAVEAARVRG